MEETKPKKREWVKNAAIIFLAVMLVLTFFSNTILNRTLPEVVTRYVEPNSIDAKVRVSGTVSARENYDVIIDQTRKVAAVNVKLGQEVSTGDVLFTLETGDSEELEQAKRELEEAQLSYQRFLVSLPDTSTDYTEENHEIEQLRIALNKAIEARDALTVPTQEALDVAAAEVEWAQALVDNLDEQIQDYEMERKEAELGVKYSSAGSEQDNDEAAKLRADVQAKQRAKSTAKKNYLSARENFKDAYGGFVNAVLDQVETDVGAQLEPDERNFVIRMLDELFWLNVLGYDDSDAIINRYNADDALFTQVRNALQTESDKKFDIVTLLPSLNDRSRESREDRIVRVLRETALRDNYADAVRMYLAQGTGLDYIVGNDTQISAFRIISDAQENYLNAANELRVAEGNMSAALALQPVVEEAKDYKGKSHDYWVKEYDDLSLTIDELTYRKTGALSELEKANAALEALKKQQSDWKAADAAVTDCQTALEDRVFRLALQQQNDQKTAGRQQQINALDIQERQRNIAELQKKIDELSGAEFSEVKAKVNGTVASISVSAGHKAEANATLATIEVKDLGYTMTATVSVDQAKLLHVGDTATVSNYYWGSQTTAVLAGMQPDPKDPRTSRTLTFDIAGDVNAGDQISFSIGERNASYDLVVPNSALRSDTNGSFVLMITAKNSPLGNRYFATRVDVEVIAADDYNTAVKGALSNMDSVITTSSGNAPVKNGDQVRLADTNNG